MPVLPTDSLPWPRFWSPFGGEISVEPDGFLTDPEDAWGRARNPTLLGTDRLPIEGAGFLGLFGEPAMGKTFAIGTLQEIARQRAPAGSDIWTKEFRSLPSEDSFNRLVLDSDRWKTWRTGSGLMTFFLDGVDEGLMKIPGFIGYLATVLQSQPVQRLRLVIACRAIEWPLADGARLAALWNQSDLPRASDLSRWELCPLRRVDVRSMTSRIKVDGDSFLQAVHKAAVGPLAARPMTLLMLLREFKEGASSLPSRQVLYGRATLNLCREQDSDRRIRLKQADEPLKARKVGERIAALLLLSNRSSIFIGQAGDGDTSELEVAAIAGGQETVGDTTFEITEDLVRRAISLPLFTLRGENRAQFPQQTYAESLAADYLKDLPIPQLRSLLCKSDKFGGYVEPQLRQLASWVASEVPEFFELLLAVDPDTLLRSDMAHLSEESKRCLLIAVLGQAELRKIFHDYRTPRFYASIAFVGIAKVLAPYVRDKQRNREVRGIALGIARECALNDLLPDLLRILGDPSDSSFHEEVAASLFAFVRRRDRPRIEKLLSQGSSIRPGKVRYNLVVSLVRCGIWTVSRSLPLLEELIGRDQGTRGIVFGGFITNTDVEAILRMAFRWPNSFDALSSFRPLVEGAYDRGIGMLDRPIIRSLFGRAWLVAKESGQFHGSEGPSLEVRLKSDDSNRRALLAELIVFPRPVKSMDWHYMTALTDRVNDFEFFLRRFHAVPRRHRISYARFLGALFVWDLHTQFLDLLIQGIDKLPDLRAGFPWMRVWYLDDPVTQQARETYNEHQVWQISMAAKREARLPAPPVWAAAVERGRLEPQSGWFGIAKNLFYRGDNSGSCDPLDLTTSAAWPNLSPESCAIVRNSARSYLIGQKGDEQFAAKGTLSNWTEFAYRALFLLKENIESDAELRTAVRKHWWPLMYSDWLGKHEVRDEMAKIAARIDPRSKSRALGVSLQRRVESKNPYFFELRIFKPVWDKFLSRQLLRFLVKRPVPILALESALEFLSEVDPSAGARLAHKRLRLRGTTPDEEVILWAWLLREFFAANWPAAATRFKRQPRFARATLWRMVGGMRQIKWPVAAVGVAASLADFYRALCVVFPYQKDPPTPEGAHQTTPRMDAARLRGEALNALVGLGTEEACDQVALIAEKSAPRYQSGMFWCFQQSLTGMRQREWQGQSPDVIKQLAAERQRRWLQSDADLGRLVLESIVRLENSLQRAPDSLIETYWLPAVARQSGRRLEKETRCAHKISNWLRHDLGKDKGITIFREVCVQWNERTDIEISAVAVSGRKLAALSVTIEIKGDWHRDVLTAAGTQLARRYLLGTGRRAGIYLVLWSRCSANAGSSSRLQATNIETARQRIIESVKSANIAYPTLSLESAVLDLSLPDSYLANTGKLQKRQRKTGRRP